jgi:hypothetical protein
MLVQGVAAQDQQRSGVPVMVAAEPPARALDHWPTLPGVGCGSVLFLAGFVLLLRTRIAARDGGAAESDSLATRFVGAFALMVTGYHVCAWSLPPDAIPLKAPLERWYWVPLLAGVAVACSRGVDRLRRSGEKGERGGGAL